MIYSMTGFGAASHLHLSAQCKVDIRSLNSKSTELNLRLPYYLRDHENDLRQIANTLIVRGKTDINIQLDLHENTKTTFFNAAIVKSIITEIEQLNQTTSNPITTTLNLALSLPEARNSQSIQLDEATIEHVKHTLRLAFDDFNTFRLREGATMLIDIQSSLTKIINHKATIANLEPERAKVQYKKLKSKLESVDTQLDTNRLEQEIIYYLEKLDINEELVRLDAHLVFFKQQCVDTNQIQKGKKMNFIAQEIGREVNTIGSKANDARIQHVVVSMKDELEKIKELVNNIL